MIEDEIMQQVRAAKEAFAASHGYDVRRMLVALQEMDAAMAPPVFEPLATVPSV